MWAEKLALYDKIADNTPGIERKGKTMPYTSSNGYMFSMLNKDGQLGIRVPKERGKQIIETYQGDTFKSHGAVLRDYVLITDKMLKDENLVSKLLLEGLEYVNSLPPK